MATRVSSRSIVTTAIANLTSLISRASGTTIMLFSSERLYVLLLFISEEFSFQDLFSNHPTFCLFHLGVPKE